MIGNAEQLSFARGSFDCVTCLGSLENFIDPEQALQEIHRVLKDGGIFCTMMPQKYWLGDILKVAFGRDEEVPFQHIDRTATLHQWRRLLECHGFAVKRIYGYVKTSPLIKQGKIRSMRKFIWTHLLALICPTSLAWSLVFICEKSLAVQQGYRAGPPWAWRAEWIGSQ